MKLSTEYIQQIQALAAENRPLPARDVMKLLREREELVEIAQAANSMCNGKSIAPWLPRLRNWLAIYFAADAKEGV